MGRKRKKVASYKRRVRPRGEKTYPTTIRLTEAKLERLLAIADFITLKRSEKGNSKQLTFTEQVNKAIDMYIKSYEGRL